MFAAVCCACLTGCQTPAPGSTSLRIAPGAYPATFQAVKDELRATGFELDRIDARAGVITTQPHFSAGLATPWIGVETTFDQELEGLFNRQRRSVRVVFAPAEAEPAAEPDTIPVDTRPVDTRTLDVELRAQIQVLIVRVHRVGLRLSPASVRLSSVAESGEHDDPDEPLWTTTVIGDDELLAARIVRGVVDRTAGR